MRSTRCTSLPRAALLCLPVTLVGALLAPAASAGDADIPSSPAAPATPTSPGGERTARFVAVKAGSEPARLSAKDREVAAVHRVAGVVTAATAPLAVRDRTSVVGVTWTGSTASAVLQWRFRAAGGTAGAWTELPSESHGPDAGTSEAAMAPRASEPLLTTDPGSVELRVLGGAASDASALLATVDEVSSVPQDATATATTTAPSRAAAAEAGAPIVRTRADWGADESIRKGRPSYGAVKGEVVHHTVNANTYSAADVPSLIRGIYQYHVTRNGWNDVGYNFLIDRFGQIWEGRAGGATKAVVGAHSPGVNSWTTSAAAIGSFTSSGTTVPTAITTAYRDLFAWKARLHQLDPDWTVNLGGKTQHSISGHRDNIATACPGAALYARLPALRTATRAATPATPDLTVRRDADNQGNNDVLVTTATGRLALVHGTDGQLAMADTTSDIEVSGLDLVRVVGDWDGDGAVDIAARVRTTGALKLYAGDGSGGFRTPVQIGNGWNTIRIMTSVGDVTGDRRPDLIAATSTDSELRVYPGNGSGSFLSPKVIGQGWQGIRSIVGIGDWNRDGSADLLGVTTAGAPIVYTNAGGGVLRTGPTLNFTAPRGATVSAIGDATGDTLNDLVVRDADGRVRVAAGSANAAVVRWVKQSPETAREWRSLTAHEG